GRHTSFSRDWSSDVCSSDLRLARRSSRARGRGDGLDVAGGLGRRLPPARRDGTRAAGGACELQGGRGAELPRRARAARRRERRAHPAARRSAPPRALPARGARARRRVPRRMPARRRSLRRGRGRDARRADAEEGLRRPRRSGTLSFAALSGGVLAAIAAAIGLTVLALYLLRRTPKPQVVSSVTFWM